MHDSYWFGFSICDLLFKGLNLHSFGGFLLTCVILVLLAALFEAIKLCQISVKLKALVLLSPSNLNLFCFNDRSSLLQNNINDGTSSSGSSSNNNNNQRTTLFFVEVLLYMLQISLGYILMLIVMTFNVYFTIALVGGAGIGYFVFGLQNAEAKLKMAKLNIPCQHCLHNNREDSAVSTLVENESVVGSSSLRQVDIGSPTEVPCSSHADAEVHPCNAETSS